MAIVILAGGMLGMAVVADTIIGGNFFSNQLTTGATLAQDKMEFVRQAGYSGLVNKPTTSTESAGSISGFPQYARVTHVDADNPETGMMTVTVTVSWDGGGRSLSLKTVLAE